MKERGKESKKKKIKRERKTERREKGGKAKEKP